MKRSTGLLALILIIAAGSMTGCAGVAHQLTCDPRTDATCNTGPDHLSLADRVRLSEAQDQKLAAITDSYRQADKEKTAQFARERQAYYASLSPADRIKAMRKNHEAGNYVISCEESNITRAQCALADRGIDTEITHTSDGSYLSGVTIN